MLIHHALAIRVIVKMLLGKIHIQLSCVDGNDANNSNDTGDDTRKQQKALHVLTAHTDCHEESEETE